ncbi:unnamed protein product [Mytilus edulis]|uniref:PHD-type domain-containing protein n=1 Tax=Mytilus edulis TaxID=6550 RepID=A0A8S3VCL0_MYTED|nr:unnamed protein product [Mytilus edulis]
MTVTGTGGVLGTLLLLSIPCNLQPREVHKTKIRNIFNNSLHEEELNSMCKSMSLQKLFPTNLEKGSKSDRHCNTIVISGSKTHTFYLLLTLILSNDISLNPGPIKYPCGECQKPVRKNQHGILCDDCELWHHIKCINMPLNQYNELSNSTDSWFCKKCTLPNFTYSFFDFHHLTSNTDTDSDDDLTVSASDITVPTSDVNTEAPILDQDDASHDMFHELYTVRKKHPNKLIMPNLGLITTISGEKTEMHMGVE